MGPCRNILNPSSPFDFLINIRNKKMKYRIQLASPPLNLIQDFPPCYLFTIPPFPPCYLNTFPPFPTCHLTILQPFTILPPFSLSQLTSSQQQINHSKTTLHLLSLPHRFLTEGWQYQNFKVGSYSPSSETISDSWIWGRICWPLDHLDTLNLINLKHYISNIKFL